MIEVHLDQYEIAEAYEFQAMLKTYKEGLESTVLGRENLNVIGKIGEMSVEKYFIRAGIPYTLSNKEYDRHIGDDFDISFTGRKGRVYKCDVKTTKKYNTIVMNERQKHKTLKKGIDLLIGVKFIRDDLCYLVGYAQPKELVYFEDYVYNDNVIKMYCVPKDMIIPFKNKDAVIQE